MAVTWIWRFAPITGAVEGVLIFSSCSEVWLEWMSVGGSERLDVQTVSLIVAFSGVSPARHMVEWSANLMYLVQQGLGRECVCCSRLRVWWSEVLTGEWCGLSLPAVCICLVAFYASIWLLFAPTSTNCAHVSEGCGFGGGCYMVRRGKFCDRVTDVTLCWLARIRDNGPVTRDMLMWVNITF